MKWNKYPEVKPTKSGAYAFRFSQKVNGLDYGYRLYNVTNGYRHSEEHLVTHWCEIENFEKAKEMMKRPSDLSLVTEYLDNFTGEDLGKFFAEVFNDDEMKEILLEKMSQSTIKGIAEDHWDDICFEEDCRIENELWASGYYTM